MNEHNTHALQPPQTNKQIGLTCESNDSRTCSAHCTPIVPLVSPLPDGGAPDCTRPPRRGDADAGAPDCTRPPRRGEPKPPLFLFVSPPSPYELTFWASFTPCDRSRAPYWSEVTPRSSLISSTVCLPSWCVTITRLLVVLAHQPSPPETCHAPQALATSASDRPSDRPTDRSSEQPSDRATERPTDRPTWTAQMGLGGRPVTWRSLVSSCVRHKKFWKWFLRWPSMVSVLVVDGFCVGVVDWLKKTVSVLVVI